MFTNFLCQIEYLYDYHTKLKYYRNAQYVLLSATGDQATINLVKDTKMTYPEIVQETNCLMDRIIRLYKSEELLINWIQNETELTAIAGVNIIKKTNAKTYPLLMNKIQKLKFDVQSRNLKKNSHLTSFMKDLKNLDLNPQDSELFLKSNGTLNNECLHVKYLENLWKYQQSADIFNMTQERFVALVGPVEQLATNSPALALEKESTKESLTAHAPAFVDHSLNCYMLITEGYKHLFNITCSIVLDFIKLNKQIILHGSSSHIPSVILEPVNVPRSLHSDPKHVYYCESCLMNQEIFSSCSIADIQTHESNVHKIKSNLLSL